MRRFALLVVAVAILLHGTEASAAKRKRVRRPRPWTGVRLPSSGTGYAIPETWLDRGLSYGAPEMIGLIERAARRVSIETPGGTLFVADLSYQHGGPSEWHRSHLRGRDADLLFFAVDDDGQPAEPPRSMIKYDADGVSENGKLHFDTARNWELVKSLVRDKRASVTRIFISAPLESMLLTHARELGESDALIAHADEVLTQPADSAPHDDHMHVRIWGNDPAPVKATKKVLAKKSVKKSTKHAVARKGKAKLTKGKAKVTARGKAKTTGKGKAKVNARKGKRGVGRR